MSAGEAERDSSVFVHFTVHYDPEKSTKVWTDRHVAEDVLQRTDVIHPPGENPVMNDRFVAMRKDCFRTHLVRRS